MEIINCFPDKVRRFLHLDGDENDETNQNGDIELTVLPRRNSDQQSSSVVSITNSFEFVENVLDYFESPHIKVFLEDSSKIYLLRLQINEKSNNLTSTELNELSRKCVTNSIVILIATKNGEDFFLYWKSKSIQHFMIFKIYDGGSFMNDIRIFEFIAQFLVNSLKRGHLGLHCKVPIAPDINHIKLHLLADHRNYNLMLIAAELGDVYIVNFMLNGGFSAGAHDTNAQTLAWNGRHFEIVLMFLKSNLTYPFNININECPDDIKDFHKISYELNEAMMSRDSTKVLEILSKNPEILHFYNIENESAPAFALRHKLLDMYQLLISKNIIFGPHEDFSEIKDAMREGEREELREIHYKESKFLPDNHMHILISNSRLGHNTADRKSKYAVIQETFQILNENPFIQIILMIVAASRNFRIVFDFNSDSVEVVDPTSNASTRGLFYLTGRIYIGAKQLLELDKKHETLGTLAHELCHYAMILVYKNFAKPYYADDNQAEEEFEEVSKVCKEMSRAEEIIGFVYNCYNSSMQHAELIVRVPHLIMQYLNNPEKFEEVKNIFGKLFEVFEKRIIPDCKEALPAIEAEAEVEAEKKEIKIIKLKFFFIFVIILSIIGIIVGVFVTRAVFHKPSFNFQKLSEVDQKSIQNAPVVYKNVGVTFKDLFSSNSTAYDKLTSDHIGMMLSHDPLNFSDPHFHYLDELVSHTWENLTKNLKGKFLTSNFTFQNESLKFQKMYESHSEPFNYLTSQQITNVLDDKNLTIHKMIKNHTKFFLERQIFDENIYEIFFSFMEAVDGRKRVPECVYHHFGRTSITFEYFYDLFTALNLTIQLQEINQIKQNESFKNCLSTKFELRSGVDILSSVETPDSLFSHKSFQLNFDEVFAIANLTKIFILSAEAGAGKTATFEQFAMRIKKKYPAKWVSYIDLKEHKFLYENIQNLKDVREMLRNIFNLNSENKFEMKIFDDFFAAGDVILLWNGFDEISPDYNAIISKVLSLIRWQTGNIQFVCTRPLYSEQLRLNFATKSYTLIPFDDDKQKEFLKRFFESERIDAEDIPEYIDIVQGIINVLKHEENFNTPLMLGMIADLIANDVDIYESENLYEIYQSFVDKKVQIWEENSEFAKKFLKSLANKNSGFNMRKLYQKYAMKIELQSLSYNLNYLNFLKLKIMREKTPPELTSDEVSRMGILYINGPKNFRFAHKTFVDFFIAQYFIENVYNADDEPSEEEAELRIQILYRVLKYNPTFIISYLKTTAANDNKIFDRPISKLLTTKFRGLLFNTLKEFTTRDYSLHFRFFNKSKTILKKMLHIDENETFFTFTYNYGKFPDAIAIFNPRNDLRDLRKDFLTPDEYEKFITGRNQKGIALFSLYCFLQYSSYGKRFSFTHEKYSLPKDLLKTYNASEVIMSISKNLTAEESKELLVSKTSPVHSFNFALYSDESFQVFIENSLSIEEQKLWLENIFDQIPLFHHEDGEYLYEKISKLFNDSEIFGLFSNSTVLHVHAAFHISTFNNSWNFFLNHTNREQQMTILRHRIQIECYLEPGVSLPNVFCYFMPFLNILQYSLLTGLHSSYNVESFTQIREIYGNYFTKSEIQEIIFSSSDFLPFLIINQKIEICETFVEYLKVIFEKNEDLLKSFLLQKDEQTETNMFELLSDFENIQNKLKLFSELLSWIPRSIHKNATLAASVNENCNEI